MELRFKLLCISSFFLIIISSSTFAEKIYSVQGGAFTMKCFEVPDVADDVFYYIELLYSKTGESETGIAQYEPKAVQVADIDTQFIGRLSFTPLYNVTIKNIQVNDEGTYTCIVKGFKVPEKKISNVLEVHVRPNVEAILMTSPLVSGSDSQNAASCSASDGKPEPKVEWTTNRHLAYNQSQSSITGSTADLKSSFSTLYITPTRFYNDQQFYCEISHPTFPDGKKVMEISLNVTYPPSKPKIDVIDKLTKLECTSDGNPTPKITWEMPGINPSPDSNIVRLISPNDPARQNDTYTCTASNGIDPSASNSITTGEAVAYVELVKKSNTGVIVGAVVGSIVLIVIIVILIYWFVIRKHREKDDGPYNPSKSNRQEDEDSGWNRSSGRRPMIQHANESLNKNAPPSPTQPPPQDDDEEASDNNSHSDVEEFTEGHDVDLNSPLTGGEDDDMPTTGIVSKNSVNFQPYWRNSVAEHRRQRPSTSPHRRSQHREQPEPSPRVTQPSHPHYEVPPKEYYEDEYDQEDERLMQDPYHPEQDEMDHRFYDLPQDRYPGYHQPRYDEPPRHEENLPPYTDTVQYASIDHDYNAGKPRTRPPYHEPVEYAEIRSKGQIV